MTFSFFFFQKKKTLLRKILCGSSSLGSLIFSKEHYLIFFGILDTVKGKKKRKKTSTAIPLELSVYKKKSNKKIICLVFSVVAKRLAENLKKAEILFRDFPLFLCFFFFFFFSLFVSFFFAFFATLQTPVYHTEFIFRHHFADFSPLVLVSSGRSVKAYKRKHVSIISSCCYRNNLRQKKNLKKLN